MTDEHLDEALNDLRAELSVTPSPEFAAKVRERIEQAPAKSSWNVWAWAGVAATCAVAVIAVAVWRGGRTETPARTESAASSNVGRAFRPGETGGAEAPARTEGIVPSDVGRPFRAGGSPAPIVHAVARRAEPEVLVPPDQLIAIRRLMAAVRAGRSLSAAPSQVLFDPDTGELLPPKPIEIPLITVDPLPGTPDGRSGGRENQ